MDSETEALFRRNRVIAALVFWAFLLFLLFRIPVGFFWILLIALPALILPIRQRALASPRFLKGVVVVLGLIPFIYIFGYQVNVSVVGGRVSPYHGGLLQSCFSGELLVSENPQKLITNELVIKSIVPPPISTFCYTSMDVCSYFECVKAETGLDIATFNNWRSYLFTIGFSAIPAFLTAFFVRLFILDARLIRTLFFWEFGSKRNDSSE